MPKMMFTNANTREVFNNRDFQDFNKLMFDTALGNEKVTKQEANDKIRKVFSEVLGLYEGATKRDIRKAIRRRKIDLYEVTEELLPNLLRTGWQDNAWYNEVVEYRNAQDGDTNEWYVEDDTILTVSELAGNHHDIFFR